MTMMETGGEKMNEEWYWKRVVRKQLPKGVLALFDGKESAGG
jgi:hypothetical protein